MQLEILVIRLAAATESNECKLCAEALQELLKSDATLIKKFCENVSSPFSCEINIIALDNLLSYSQVDEPCLLLLAANVVLHSLCSIVRKCSLLRQLAHRLPLLQDDFIEFLFVEMKDDETINCLIDGVMINMNCCPFERQVKLLKTVFKASARIRGTHKYFLSSIVGAEGCGLCGVREMSGFGVSDRVNDGRWFK